MNDMISRSRNGCLTCRIRRVKCDETLPSCNKCKDSGRVCEGPSKDKFTFVILGREKKTRENRRASPPDQALAAPLSRPRIQDIAEIRAFSYFLTCVAPTLAGGFDRDFWTLVVPQISESDTSIRHAVLAISDLYEHPPEHRWAARDAGNTLAISDSRSLQALKWYNQSLSRFRKHMNDQKDSQKAQLALLSCILYTSLEFQQNNVQNALKLLGRGYDVFALAVDSSNLRIALKTPLIEDTLMPMFHRHVVLMACFGHQPPGEWGRRFNATAQPELGAIVSLHEARKQLFHLASSCLGLVMETGALIGSKQRAETMARLQDQQLHVMRGLHRWYTSFQALVQQISPTLDAPQKSAAFSLMTYFCCVEIWAQACLDPSPMVYDQYQHRFEQLIEHAMNAQDIIRVTEGSHPAPYSFEMGIIPPLYFTCWKCHHPRIRRQAMALIRSAPAQEALFSADLNYRAAKKIIEIEEGSDVLPTELAEYDACVQAGAKIVLPKEEDRVNGVVVHYENSRGEKEFPCLIYTKGKSPDKYAWEQEAITVPI